MGGKLLRVKFVSLCRVVFVFDLGFSHYFRGVSEFAGSICVCDLMGASAFAGASAVCRCMCRCRCMCSGRGIWSEFYDF